MKKLTISVIALLTLSLCIYSCMKDKNECKTCSEIKTEKVKMNLLGVDIDLTNYPKEKAEQINYKNALLKNEDILEIAKNLDLSKYIGGSDLISIAVFLNSGNSTKLTHNKESISGVLLYLSDKEEFYTKLISIKDGGHEISEFSKKVYLLSINDLMMLVSNNVLQDNIQSIIQLSNKDITNYKKSLPQFSSYLKKINRNRLKIAGGGDVCGFPCTNMTGSCCVVKISNTGSYSSQSINCNYCCIRNMYDDLGTAIVHGTTSNLNFNFIIDKEHLNEFKNDYIGNTVKGTDYISKLDFLTNRFNEFNNSPSWQYCLSTVVFFHESVIPIINNLENPAANQSSTLISNNDKVAIVSFLNSFKQFFNNDAQSIQIINSLISDVEFNSNKSISNVKTYLNT